MAIQWPTFAERHAEQTAIAAKLREMILNGKMDPDSAYWWARSLAHTYHAWILAVAAAEEQPAWGRTSR